MHILNTIGKINNTEIIDTNILVIALFEMLFPSTSLNFLIVLLLNLWISVVGKCNYITQFRVISNVVPKIKTLNNLVNFFLCLRKLLRM